MFEGGDCVWFSVVIGDRHGAAFSSMGNQNICCKVAAYC
jgi:hypothetical protein